MPKEVALRRLNTPTLTPPQREIIRRYREHLRRQGLNMSNSAALLMAAMQCMCEELGVDPSELRTES